MASAVKVYVVMEGRDYEGETLLDVFASREGARAGAEAAHRERLHEPQTLYWAPNDVAEFCNGKWTIYECQVRA